MTRRDFEKEQDYVREERVSEGKPTAEQVDEPVGPKDDDTYVAKVARGAGISTAGQGVGRVIGYVTQVAIACSARSSTVSIPRVSR